MNLRLKWAAQGNLRFHAKALGKEKPEGAKGGVVLLAPYVLPFLASLRETSCYPTSLFRPIQTPAFGWGKEIGFADQERGQARLPDCKYSQTTVVGQFQIIRKNSSPQRHGDHRETFFKFFVLALCPPCLRGASAFQTDPLPNPVLY